jgi:hypothetical protein
MYNALLHAHSGLRWIVLVLIIWALFKSFSGWLGKKRISKFGSAFRFICDGIFPHSAISGIVALHGQPKRILSIRFNEKYDASILHR